MSLALAKLQNQLTLAQVLGDYGTRPRSQVRHSHQGVFLATSFARVQQRAYPLEEAMVALLLQFLALGGLLVPASAHVIPLSDLPPHRVEVQAHRGGVGLRPESTLWAFAYAMEIGVDVAEADIVFTKDEIPVVWHDHWIQPEKCNDTTGSFVGRYIANLTLAELKTLDCGSKQLQNFPQAELHPGATIATLKELLDLVDCYGDKDLRFNLETKLDPLRPNETFPVEQYVTSPHFIPYLKERGFLARTTIQSFDWRTLMGVKKKWGNDVATVALVDPTTITPQDGRGEGYYPWLGGIDLNVQYNGSYLLAAHAIGATIISPMYGAPGTVNTPNYTPFVTKDLVERSHKLGMKVIPWTIDDESSISSVLELGVDGIISDYPERVIWVARQRGLTVGKSRRPSKLECLKHASMEIP